MSNHRYPVSKIAPAGRRAAWPHISIRTSRLLRIIHKIAMITFTDSQPSFRRTVGSVLSVLPKGIIVAGQSRATVVRCKNRKVSGATGVSPVQRTSGWLRGGPRFRSGVLNGRRTSEQVSNPVRLLGLCSTYGSIGFASISHGVSSSPISRWIL